MTAKFISDWHGVPAGTQVKIVRRGTLTNGAPAIVVERVDGEELPGPFAKSHRVTVAAEYVGTVENKPCQC